MSLLNLIQEAFRKEKETNIRDAAKERLRLVLIDDRNGRAVPDYMPQLRGEIIAVIKKYVRIADDKDVEINVARRDSTCIMEMSVSLDSETKPKPPTEA